MRKDEKKINLLSFSEWSFYCPIIAYLGLQIIYKWITVIGWLKWHTKLRCVKGGKNTKDLSRHLYCWFKRKRNNGHQPKNLLNIGFSVSTSQTHAQTRLWEICSNITRKFWSYSYLCHTHKIYSPSAKYIKNIT